MTMTWTSKQIRAEAHLPQSHVTRQMLLAYAERVEADERAEPIYQYHHEDDVVWMDCDKLDVEPYESTGVYRTRKLYTRPQTPEVEALRRTLIWLRNHYEFQLPQVDRALVLARVDRIIPSNGEPDYSDVPLWQPQMKL